MSDSLDSSEGAEKADERVAEVLPVMLELAIFAGPEVGELTGATESSDAVFEALDMVSMTSLSGAESDQAVLVLWNRIPDVRRQGIYRKSRLATEIDQTPGRGFFTVQKVEFESFPNLDVSDDRDFQSIGRGGGVEGNRDGFHSIMRSDAQYAVDDDACRSSSNQYALVARVDL